MCRNYEAAVKKELNREDNWGLPPPEMMTPELWESIKLHELQMCSKRPNPKRSLRLDQENDLRHLTSSLSTFSNTTTLPGVTDDLSNPDVSTSTSGVQSALETDNYANSTPTNYDDNDNYTDDEQNSSSQDGDEEAFQLLEDTARLRQELDDLEEMEISLRDSTAVRQLYNEWMAESEGSIPSFSPETLSLLQNAQDRDAMNRASSSSDRVRTPSGSFRDPLFRDNNSEQYNRVCSRNLTSLLETLHEQEDEDFDDRFDEELHESEPGPPVVEMTCDVIEAVESDDSKEIVSQDEGQTNIPELQNVEEVVVMVEEEQINVSSPLCRPTELEIRLVEKHEKVHPVSGAESVSIEELQQTPSLVNTLEEVTSYLLSFEDGTSEGEFGIDFDATGVECRSEALDQEKDVDILIQDNFDKDTPAPPVQNLMDTSIQDDVVEILDNIFSCITQQVASDDDGEPPELVLIEEPNEPEIPLSPSSGEESAYSLVDSSESEDTEFEFEEVSLSKNSKTGVIQTPKVLKVHFLVEPEHQHAISDDKQLEETKKSKKSQKRTKLTVSTNPESDDYYDPDNYVTTTDSDEEYAEKISPINYLVGENPLFQTTRYPDSRSVVYVEDSESDDTSQGSNPSLEISVVKTELTEDEDPDRVVDYESETSKSSESDWETKSESDSDTEFRNLVDTPSANYVRTPRHDISENLNIAPLEDDEDDEDFVSGQGWSLPSPNTWEANNSKFLNIVMIDL